MASFHSLMEVEESKVCDLTPRQGDDTGGCIKTRAYLSDVFNQEEGKENHPPMLSPAPSKKRRMAPLEGCEGKIREAHTHTPDLRLNGREEGDMDQAAEYNHTVNKGLLRSSENEDEIQPVLLSTPLHGCCEPPISVEHHIFSSRSNQQDNLYETQSPTEEQDSDLRSASSEESFSAFQLSLRPSELEINAAENDSSRGPATKKIMKRVHFGGPLSPEFFDKHLPPSTPLQKGGTPAEVPTQGSTKLHSVLKTPQKNEICTPQAQSDFSGLFGASPALAAFHKHRRLPMEEDGVEELGKIIFPSIEESDSTSTIDTELMNSAQLNLNNAFNEEHLSQVETTVKSETSPAYQLNALNEQQSESEEKQPEAVSNATARLKNWEKKAVAKSEFANGFPDARSRKRKLPEESKPVRRSARSAAKVSETIKLTSTASNRWKKEVNHSLYGYREYASKNPSLSPITELFMDHSATAQQTPPTSNKDESTSSGPWTAVSFGDNPSGAPVPTGKRATKKKRNALRSKIMRGFKKVSVSVNGLCVEPQRHTSEKTSENDEEITTIIAASVETPTERSILEQVSAGGEEHCTQTIALLSSIHTHANSECHLIVDAPAPACLFKEPQSSTVTSTAAAPRATQQARIMSRSRRGSVNLAEEKHTQEVETQQKKLSSSKSESPKEEAQDNSGLASWQTRLNIEDVFKSVPGKGQRSVRRSLRNQSNTDNQTGLAWILRLSS
ncbi:cell division cycle-associated protein 2 isoform X2 [Syngnathoides biaculeatus]|nr:cell division cycle-associated protein 2 isoform X2 [Syngnathoides biaculeatus]